jgi:hypothetical protein
MLLDEWRAYFAGPSKRRWYLSDGGYFENTALYELLRRRLPLIVAIDAECDPDYRCGDLALLVRQARLDFGASFDWIDPTRARASGRAGWSAIDASTVGAAVPDWIRNWLDPDALGPLPGLTRESPFGAALARVSYAKHDATATWLVLLKPNLGPDLPLDVRSYAADHSDFPQQPTSQQFFDDPQWESYRRLGQCAAERLFRR